MAVTGTDYRNATSRGLVLLAPPDPVVPPPLITASATSTRADQLRRLTLTSHLLCARSGPAPMLLTW
jgi:hypothetical protein